MEASHKTHLPHIKVGKDEEEEEEGVQYLSNKETSLKRTDYPTMLPRLHPIHFKMQLIKSNKLAFSNKPIQQSSFWGLCSYYLEVWCMIVFCAHLLRRVSEVCDVHGHPLQDRIEGRRPAFVPLVTLDECRREYSLAEAAS